MKRFLRISAKITFYLLVVSSAILMWAHSGITSANNQTIDRVALFFVVGMTSLLFAISLLAHMCEDPDMAPSVAITGTILLALRPLLPMHPWHFIKRTK